jgi:hypothetical protein
MPTMILDKLINYAIASNDVNMEFEIKFGKYSRLSSNLTQKIFFNIMAIASGKSRSYQLIDETFYDDIRLRVIYADSALVKNMFDNPANISTESINKLVSTHKAQGKSITRFIKKEKIRQIKPVRTPNYKADIVIENILDEHAAKTKIGNTAPKLRKYKMRCSWVDGMWRFDCTIALIHDLKSGKCAVFYEAEIEYINSSKAKYEQLLEKTGELINAVTTIIECSSFSNPVDIPIKYGMFNSVVTLERIDLAKLEAANYAVVDKADGERKFVQVDSKGNVYQFNPTEVIPDKQSMGKCSLKNTLIDCELVDGVFYAFDLLFCAGKDYRSHNLPERLGALSKVVGSLGKKFKVKKFYLDNVFANAKKLWDNRAKLVPYELDGLIFTPIRGAYVGNLPNLKFKPKVSIDVRVMYNRRDDFTEFYPHSYPIVRDGQVINEYADRKSGKVFYKRRFNLNDSTLKSMNVVNKYGALGISGHLDEVKQNMIDIVEMEYDPATSKWIYLRTRPDKEVPNAYKTVLSAITAIKDNITIGDIGKLKHKKSVYERIGGETASCFSPIGFNFDASSITGELCRFYSEAYCNMLNSAKGKSILVLGCDACLLNGLINSNYADITIIEDNCLEVYGCSKSEGYMGLLETVGLTGTKKKINIIWGDSVAIKAYNKQGRGLLSNALKSNKQKFDTIFINSFESCLIESNKFSKKKYDGVMSIVKQLLKPSGKLMGIYLSADQIMKCVAKPCIITRNKDLHPLWKLNTTELKKYKKADLFANVPQMLEIKRLRNSFVAECQPVVFDANIASLVKEAKCGSIKSLSKERLGQYDSIIASLTKYFIV